VEGKKGDGRTGTRYEERECKGGNGKGRKRKEGRRRRTKSEHHYTPHDDLGSRYYLCTFKVFLYLTYSFDTRGTENFGENVCPEAKPHNFGTSVANLANYKWWINR